MDSFSAYGFLCVSTFALLIIYLFSKSKREKYLQVPEPKGIPFFGNVFQLDSTALHRTLDKWAHRLGDMYCFTVFGKKFLVINSSKKARELYLTEPSATLTSGRAKVFVATDVMKGADLVLQSYSPDWVYRRKVAHQVLRVYGEGLRNIENKLLFTLDHVKQKIKENENTSMNPEVIVDNFLLEILEVLLIGQSGNKDLRRSIKIMDDAFNVLTTPIVARAMTFFPWIKYFPFSATKSLNECLSERKRIMDILHETAKQNPNLNGIYQNLVRVAKEDQPKTEKKITMEQVEMILHDFCSAGYMTTRGTLLSIIKILMSRPDVQIKLQEEVDRVVGLDGTCQLTDRENCPYTEAVILETLRYISHTPLTPHTTLDEFEYKGILIPKGCTLTINVWHIHHNPKEWDEPFKFKPERFLDDDGNLLPATHPLRKKLATFGYGKRACIGEVLAKSRTFLFLASIMQLYTIRPPCDEEIPIFHPTEMKQGSVLLPFDFKCKFVKR